MRRVKLGRGLSHKNESYLHEPREDLSEPSALFSEQSRLGNATRVHGRENDTGILVIAAVQFGDGHHVANLIENVLG